MEQALKKKVAIMTFQRFVNCVFGSIAFLACIGTFIVFLICGDKTQDYTLSRILRITIPLVLLIAVMIIGITKCLWNGRRSIVELRTEEEPNVGNNNGGYQWAECEYIAQFNSFILASPKTFCKLEITLISQCSKVGIENDFNQLREKGDNFLSRPVDISKCEDRPPSCNGWLMELVLFESKDQCMSLPVSRIIQLPGVSKTQTLC